MTQEEKAKAYDEALVRARKLYNDAKANEYKSDMEDYESIFPQLAESEDERIRKTLIDALKTSKSVGELKFILPEPTREECLAYLEKQGEQKVSVDDFKAKDWYVSKVDGKIHNIYYSVDKVKPKFKVGDKIIEKNFDECGRGTIIDIKDGKYIFDDGGFICIEEQGLWKLVEQKPAEYIKRNSKEWYSLLAEQYDKGFWKGKAEQKPAEWSPTKEQMVALSWAANGMLDNDSPSAGDIKASLRTLYNDLQSKSIRPAEWSEEEKEILDSILSHYVLIDKPIDANGISKEKYISLIKSIRFDTYKNCNSQKQEWDTHDKAIVNCIVCCLDGQFVPEAARKQSLEWFNKHRRDFLNSTSWKPSEEQMKSLDIYRKVPLKHSIDREMLDSLYEQLKKLM